MSDWSSGYNVDLGYTYGAYRELAPAWLDYVATARGVAAPTAAWRYLELGCGQGVGLVLLAALNPEHDFLGIDFNPLHIAHARGLADAAGLTNVRFEEADFVELARDWPSDWGKFDYVTLHGIYTWLAEDVRRGLVGTIERATAPGAIVYVSYNSMPGWISTAPVQHLLRLWQTSEDMPSVQAVTTGIERLNALTEVKSGMTRALPTLKARLESMEKQDRSYLVQEYLHDNWHPMWFDQVAEELGTAKLGYVGTASVGDLYLPSVMPKPQQELLARHSNPVVREVMIDVLVNQSFRRDVFARGAVPLWPAAQTKALTETRVTLGKLPAGDEIKFKLSVGEVTGKPEIYRPLLDALADGPKTMGELAATRAGGTNPFGDTTQAVTMLLQAGMARLHAPAADQAPARALNRAIMHKVAQGAPYGYLAAAETGAVLAVSDTEMIMLAAVTEQGGPTERGPLSEVLVRQLVTLRKALVHDGKPLRTPDEMRQQAQALAGTFLDRSLPAFRAQGVV